MQTCPKCGKETLVPAITGWAFIHKGIWNEGLELGAEKRSLIGIAIQGGLWGTNKIPNAYTCHNQACAWFGQTINTHMLRDAEERARRQYFQS